MTLRMGKPRGSDYSAVRLDSSSRNGTHRAGVGGLVPSGSELWAVDSIVSRSGGIPREAIKFLIEEHGGTARIHGALATPSRLVIASGIPMPGTE
jgi:hypothetical protein